MPTHNIIKQSYRMLKISNNKKHNERFQNLIKIAKLKQKS